MDTRDVHTEQRRKNIREKSKTKTDWGWIFFLIACLVFLLVHINFQFKILEIETGTIHNLHVFSALEHSENYKNATR